jgi:tetratricopeptide (TPR) repeat protein
MIVRRILAGSIVAACLVAQAEPVNPKIVARYKEMLAARPTEGTALDRLWKIYLDENRTNELIDEYKAGGTFASEMVFGHLLRKVARLEEAAAAFDRAAALDAKSPLPWQALAQLRTEQGQHRSAAEALEKATAALPERDAQQAELLLQLGSAWLAAGDAAQAAKAWERTVALDPANLDLRRRLADAYLTNHLPDRAIAHLEYLEKNAPPQERAQALQQLARVHQGTGNQDAAIGALERALTYTAPGNWLRAELQSQIIRLHQRYHRVVELETRWRKYAADNPRDIAAYLQLIDLYERTGELDRQRDWLKELSALAPKTAEYRLKLARVLVHLDDLDGAAVVYDQLLKEQPGSVDLVFERARLDVQRDRTDAARERITALLAAAPKDETVRGRALEFFELHRLNDLVEAHLRADAASGAEEPLVALANFLFSQHREAEAQAALDRLAPANAPAEARAAALFKKAQILKAQNDLPAAATALRQAIALMAKPRELYTLLGEIEAALGHTPEARAAYEQAFALSATPAEQLAADQKLFESFRSESPKTDGVRRAFAPPNLPPRTAPVTLPRTVEGVRPTFTSPSIPGLVEVVAEPNTEVQSYLLGITRGAAEKPTAEGWLRVARWHLWSHNVRPAAEYAQKALALEPDSLAAHEFMVKLGSSDPRSAAAIVHLEELQRLDSAHQADYKRRAGQLELQAGRIAEAERIFSELAAANPGNAEALVDLALAQQREEAWEKALATWQKAYAISPTSRKKEAIGPLLRVYERLNRHREAAVLLFQHIDSLGDEKEQFAAFQDLLNLCAKHNLVGWLREEMEKRRKLRTDDYFTEIALGRVLKLTGNKAAAFEVLADAAFAAPNQAEALPELVREAEELRKLDAAIRLQEQLVRILPQREPEPLIKLARLQEKNFDLSAAAKTWEKVAARFPRDAGALEQAVEFQLRSGTAPRAAELLRRIRELDPGNLRALTQLAQLDIEAGKAAEARECLEQVLAHSEARAENEPLRVPGVKVEDAGRLQTTYLTTVRHRRGRPTAEVMRALRNFWAEDEQPGRSDRDVHLSAIRDLGKLVQLQNDPAATKAWIERWNAKGTSPTEALWALYFAGANDALFDRFEALMKAAPGDPQLTSQLKQGFIWLALQTGEFDRLGAWLQDKRRTSVERDYLLVALQQHLQTRGGRIEPDLIEKLFPQNYKLRAWEVAVLLGQRGNFRAATELGARVFDSLSTQRAGYGLLLAHWHLDVGEVEDAKRVLRASLDQPGESFDAPVYAALREYYLLLPENERAAFADSYLQSIDAVKQPVHATLARTLLAGLAGKSDEARAQMRRLLDFGAMANLDGDEPGNSASRYWDFVLSAGAQLQSWKLDRLAVFLWETALADEALIRLEMQTQGERVQARTNDIRARMTALQMLRASPFDASAILERYQRHSGPDGLAPVADALEAFGAYGQAILVNREIWEREPANPKGLRDLTASCHAGTDNETLEEVLGRCVREGFFRANDAVHRDLAMQLADRLQQRGAYAQARIVLGEAIDNTPADARLLMRLGQLHERAGRHNEAEAAYRRLLQFEPINMPARLALAPILEAQNRLPEAIDLLEKFSGLEVDPLLVQLYLKDGRLDDALATLERISPPNHVAVALLLANGLAERGNVREAKNVLRQAMTRNADLRSSLPLQTRLIELLDPTEDRDTVAREVRRLRQMAGDQPELLGAYGELLLREAPRLNYGAEFARELTEDWDEGAGLASAGVTLLAWQLQNAARPAAETTWTRILARDDVSEAQWIQTVSILEKAQLPELAAQAHARLARQAPLNYKNLFDWVRALKALGRKEEALLVLDELGNRAVLNDEIGSQAAKLFAEFDKPERAKRLYAEAIAGDPAARNFPVYLDYARLLLTLGDVSGARQQLRVAFRNPANRECGELIAFLESTGRLADFDREIAAFELRPVMLLATRRALFAHYEKGRDVAAAVALVDEHPEIMEAGLSARLRALAAATKQFDKVAALFERIVLQAPLESVEPSAELAGLYGDWAEVELTELRDDAALAHLQRSHELKADLFAPMQRLAEMLLKRSDPAAAARVVQDFLAASQVPAEKEKAQQLFERIDR